MGEQTTYEGAPEMCGELIDPPTFDKRPGERWACLRLKGHAGRHNAMMPNAELADVRDECDALRHRVEHLRKALGWYADPKDWKPEGYSYDTDYGREWDESPPAIFADQGQVARAALLLDEKGLADDVTDEEVAAFDVLDDAGIYPSEPMKAERRNRLARKLRESVKNWTGA